MSQLCATKDQRGELRVGWDGSLQISNPSQPIPASPCTANPNGLPYNFADCVNTRRFWLIPFDLPDDDLIADVDMLSRILESRQPPPSGVRKINSEIVASSRVG